VLRAAIHGGEATRSERDLGAALEYVWEVTSVKALDVESDLPRWYDPCPWLQLSEFGSWAEVVEWGRNLYEPRLGLSPAVQEKLREIREENSTLEGRALSAIRFVQDDVRYLAVLLGEGSHVPNPPGVVMKRRFGDCKDKALLLTAMLRDLGMDAHPAYVNTEFAYGIGTWLPTPTAFNHVIVRAVSEGDTFWVDPTNSRQRGSLKNLYAPQYGLALPLAPDTKDLEFVATPVMEEPSVSVSRMFTMGGPTDPVRLSVTTTYRGRSADETRRSFAETSPSEMAEVYLDWYESIFGSARRSQELNVDDDTKANVFSVREHYILDEFWTSGTTPGWADFYPYEAALFLASVDSDERRMPIGIAYPHHFVHNTLVQLSEEWPSVKSRKSIDNPSFRFSRKTEIGGKWAEFRFEYKALSDHVPVAQAAQYEADVETLNDELQQGLYWDKAAGDYVAGGINWPITMVSVFSLVVAIPLCLRWYRRPPAIGPALKPAKEGSPSGLRGWLMLVAIGVWTAPLMIAAGVIYPLAETTAPAAWAALTDPGSPAYHAGWGPMLTMNVIVATVSLAWCVLNLVLMVKHMRSFPMMYAMLNVVMIAWGLVQLGTLAWIMGTMDTMVPELAGVIWTILGVALWVTYLYRSNRSRATFIRPAPSDLLPSPAPAPGEPSLVQPLVLGRDVEQTALSDTPLPGGAVASVDAETAVEADRDPDGWEVRDPIHFKQAYELLMMGRAPGRVITQIERTGLSSEEADSLVGEVWKENFAGRREEGRGLLLRGAGVFLIGAFLSLLMSDAGELAWVFVVAGSIYAGIAIVSGFKKIVLW
jgi:hypothetical protein